MLILASESPQRKELLARLNLPFESYAPQIDETPKENESCSELVVRLSVGKAETAANQYPSAVIIGSDAVAEHDGRPIGKPHNYDTCVEFLQFSSDKWIKFYTGVAVLNTQTRRSEHMVSPFAVKFRKLNTETIENYLKKEQPYHCAGGLRSTGLGITLLEKMQGDDPTALVGLPLIALSQLLVNAGVKIF